MNLLLSLFFNPPSWARKYLEDLLVYLFWAEMLPNMIEISSES